MTLQTRLTLSSVLVTTVMVAVISTVDLGNDMERQFEDTLRRAELIRTNVSNAVRQAVERERDLSLVSPAAVDPVRLLLGGAHPGIYGTQGGSPPRNRH